MYVVLYTRYKKMSTTVFGFPNITFPTSVLYNPKTQFFWDLFFPQVLALFRVNIET